MKRFYVVVFSVLCLSVVLLGFSFSKETGTNDLSFLNEKETDDYRAVYSNGNVLNTVNNTSTVISITNRKSELVDIVVTFEEKNDLKYKNVFYKIGDGPEHVLVEESIKLGSLNAYGRDGDHRNFNIEIYTKDDSEYNFLIKINNKVENKNTINNFVKTSSQVYTDLDGDVRYFGENVNNYILYNDETYRIIGIVDGKIKILSEIKDLGVYDTSKGEYASLEDYLLSFNNTDVNENNVLSYKSWMMDKGFGLNDQQENKSYYASAINGVGLYNKNVDFYLRYVEYLDINSSVVSGDGTLNNPYEVTYGSK